MATTRRRFVQTVGASAAAFIAARGREAWTSSGREGVPFTPEVTSDLFLSSNENPLGPGPHVLDAVRKALGADGAGAGRYMFAQQEDAREAVARAHGTSKGNVMIGAGSSEILRLAADVFTSKERSVITPDPTFATCAGFAELLGHPVKRIPLDPALRVDLEATLSEIDGAGLVYLCNPNNPTATVRSEQDMRAAIADMLKRSPETTILIDEAYHEYVTDPSHVSLLPLAIDHPRVIVARTFSKAYGMAGLRLGFAVAHEETIQKMTDWRGVDMLTNLPGRVGAIAALEDTDRIAREQARNEAVRDFTRKFFHDAGYEDTPSQANFVFVDIRRSGEKFQKDCRERGVRISRGSEKYPSYTRVSLGTMEEMERATEIFADVLGA